jgi:sigma-B regulation protein RsbU (phosphoserine phosphatase)
MNLDPQVQARFIGEIIYLIAGTVFLTLALIALVVAAIRRRSAAVLAVFWLGIWSALYGIQRLNDCSFLVALLPGWIQTTIPYLHAFCTYLVLVAGLLAFRELTKGGLRQFTTILAGIAALIAVFGIGHFLLTGDEDWMNGPNNFVAALSLVVLVICFIIPSLSRRYATFGDRGIVVAGALIFGVQALRSNVAHYLGFRFDAIWDDLGFLAFLLPLAYVAMKQVDSSERRLVSIENELAVARQLQFSILPTTTPEVRNLRIAAVYEPMTAVAGDFYEYLSVDNYRAGFLVADVSGHGVPAALIASMIKVAALSASTHAADPSEFLRLLGETLSGQLRGQFVSAAYLWIDTQTRVARYSAAGHPPLFFWCAGCASLQRIESNGPLFGTPCNPDFPTREISFTPGDRFLLYTDGLSEPENAAGEAFSDHRIEQLLRDNYSRSAAELSLLLLDNLGAWPPTAASQQDDITFLVIDVL